MPGQKGTGRQRASSLRLELEERKGGSPPRRNNQAVLRRLQHLTGDRCLIAHTRSWALDDIGVEQKVTRAVEVAEGVWPWVKATHVVVYLRRRLRPINSAVVAGEPGRERDLVGVLLVLDDRARIKCVDRRDQQLGTKLGEPRLQAGTRVVRFDWD